MTRRRRVERPIVPMLAAILVGVYLWKFWHPVPTNANFSWQMRSGWPSGRVLATLLSSGTAVVCVLAFARLAQTSLPGLVVLPGLVMAVLAACFMGWLLYPTVCDKRERFLARPNETCRCLGVTAWYCPRGIYDGAEIGYRIGLESTLARSLLYAHRAAAQGFHRTSS